MMHSLSKNVGVVVVGLIVFGTLSLARAQTETQGKPAHSRHGQMGGTMMEECKAMMSSREEMKSEMGSAQAKLDALVEQMNVAEGDAKMEAMAEVITALAAQRKSMMSKMMGIQPQMMHHTMRHMRMSMEEGAGSAMECPMMKEMEAQEKDPSSQ
jgi:hypothetical protein